MQTRPEKSGGDSDGAERSREALRAALAAKRHGRAENPVCLRGGWWWATGPARVPTVEHPPLCTGEKRNERRRRGAAVWRKDAWLV